MPRSERNFLAARRGNVGESRGSCHENSFRTRHVSFIHLFIALNSPAQSDIYFLPCSTNATVSFEGETQLGRDVHRFEVRRLAYTSPKTKREMASWKSCVIYFAGEEYGPEI